MNRNSVLLATLPEKARNLLRAARIRPIKQGCFINAAKVVLGAGIPKLKYAEGWVRTLGSAQMFAHAWVIKAGRPIDVTLPELPEVLTCRRFNPRTVGRILFKRKVWGEPLTPELVPARGVYPPYGWPPRMAAERRAAR